VKSRGWTLACWRPKWMVDKVSSRQRSASMSKRGSGHKSVSLSLIGAGARAGSMIVPGGTALSTRIGTSEALVKYNIRFLQHWHSPSTQSSATNNRSHRPKTISTQSSLFRATCIERSHLLPIPCRPRPSRHSAGSAWLPVGRQVIPRTPCG
jgi:hypothetical protein